MSNETNYQPKDVAGRLARTFLHNPLTMVLGISLLLIGYLALVITPREEDPQMEVSGGAIMVAMPGATPKEIENVIIKPLERRIREIKGVEHIFGVAAENVGIVNVQYYIGEDREESNLKLYDKVMQNMDLLPKTAMQPLVKPFDIDIDVPIISVAFYPTDDRVGQTELFKKVRDIQYELNRIGNVAKTELKGARKEQYNILVDLNKLTGYHLSLGQIVQALESLAVNVPNVKTRTEKGELVVFGVKNAIESIEDVQNVIVAQYMGSAIYLKDIATVEIGDDIQNYAKAQIMFKDAEGNVVTTSDQLTLTVAKLKGTNAVFIAEDIEESLEAMKEELAQEGIGYIVTRDYGERANEAVNELVFHLLISIVIIAVLLVFVLGWKESMIVTFTVPAILAVTLFIAYMTDQTINRITLFAFLLSLGLLVDAAIIVIENIHRHLHAHDAVDKEMDEIMVEATDEIGAPTNVATVAIILTMVPMAFVGQMMGQFMKPIPANVPVALFASLVVAYIFTPFLARKLLKKPHMHHHQHHFQKDRIAGADTEKGAHS
jgi:multidrug efflux pump subunit AcrB